MDISCTREIACSAFQGGREMEDQTEATVSSVCAVSLFHGFLQRTALYVLVVDFV